MYLIVTHDQTTKSKNRVKPHTRKKEINDRRDRQMTCRITRKNINLKKEIIFISHPYKCFFVLKIYPKKISYL